MITFFEWASMECKQKPHRTKFCGIGLVVSGLCGEQVNGAKKAKLCSEI